MAVAHEVTPDDGRHCRIVVYDDDPAWRIGVAYQGFPVPCKKGNDYASTVRRKQPVKPVNRAKASRLRKHSDDSVRSGLIGAELAPPDSVWVNTKGCFAPPGPATRYERSSDREWSA